MKNKSKIILVVLVLIILPPVKATYQTDWLGGEKRVESVNYSVAQIEGLFTEVEGGGIDFHISEQNNFEPTKYDASINLYEITPEEIGIVKTNLNKYNIFEDYHDDITYNETINNINIYSFRRNYGYNSSEYYTYSVYEKDGHLYALSGYHGREINYTTLQNDAELFKEIVDSIERKN